MYVRERHENMQREVTFTVTLWNIWQRNVVYNQRLGVERVKVELKIK